MDECLKLCIEYGVNDATIYLYQTTGDRGKAFDITIRIFEDTFNKISSNLPLKNLMKIFTLYYCKNFKKI